MYITHGIVHNFSRGTGSVVLSPMHNVCNLENTRIIPEDNIGD